MLATLTFISGVAVGALHVVIGPDHLCAVAPLSSEKHHSAWSIGLKWGLGHAGGFWLVAAAAMLLRDLISVEWLSAQAEAAVGITLVAIGLWAFRGMLRDHLHLHAHTHGEKRHIHFHLHQRQAEQDRHRHFHGHTAIGIGALHGVAGSAELTGLLPVIALPSEATALSYIAGFGIGAIVAMPMMSWLVGRYLMRLSSKSPAAVICLRFGFAFAAISVGAYWLGSTA